MSEKMINAGAPQWSWDVILDLARSAIVAGAHEDVKLLQNAADAIQFCGDGSQSAVEEENKKMKKALQVIMDLTAKESAWTVGAKSYHVAYKTMKEIEAGSHSHVPADDSYVFVIIDEGLCKKVLADTDPIRLAGLARTEIEGYLAENGFGDEEKEALATDDGYAKFVRVTAGDPDADKHIWSYSFDGEVSLNYAFMELNSAIQESLLGDFE